MSNYLKKNVILIHYIYLSGVLSGFLIQSHADSCPVIKIIDDQKALAMIDIDTNHKDKLYQTAITLQKYIHKSTGAKLPFSNEVSSDKHPVLIHLTIQDNTKNEFSIASLRYADGFYIDISSPNHIWIKGYSAIGAEYGVYEFLERFLGVRWLFPGELGEHIPKQKTLTIQGQNIKQFPAFVSRQMSGLYGKECYKWAKIHRSHGVIRFHHNLHKIFPIDPYVKTHPHLFPQKEGKPDVQYARAGWQPCFQEKETISIAVQHIESFFEKNPTIHSFSLGTNDGVDITSGYCSADIDLKGLNDWGYPDASDVYYQWTNIVAQKVLERYPNKIFGTLAYMEVAMPPKSISLNHQIIPFLTEDRLRWVKPSYEAKAKKWVTDWTKKAKYIGFYDYLYGTPYVLPRVYFHHMADVYQFAHKKGVIAVYAEAYPNWGEGPKYYLAFKLLWNPSLNVDKILEDWYISCVGTQAAPYLARYFNLWEMFWTNNIQDIPWFFNKSMYMAFWSPSYLDHVEYKAIKTSRALLEKTLALCETDIQKKRAKLFLNAFEYYEATAISYWGLQQKRSDIPKQLADKMNVKRYHLINKFSKDFLLKHPNRFDNRNVFNELNWQ